MKAIILLEEKFNNFKKFIANEIIIKYNIDMEDPKHRQINFLINKCEINELIFFLVKWIIPVNDNNKYFKQLMYESNIDLTEIDPVIIARIIRYLDFFCEVIKESDIQEDEYQSSNN
jgi:hypothetical protein